MDLGFNTYGAFDGTNVESALRPLGWSELCARLVAAQDYRRGLARPDVRLIGGRDPWNSTAPGGALGSFHSGTARMLEHFDSGNRAINSNSSTYGKDTGGTPVDSRPPSLSAFAERQADENRHD